MRHFPGAPHVDGRVQQARQSRFYETLRARGSGSQGSGCCPCCPGAMATAQRLTTFPPSTPAADPLPSSQRNSILPAADGAPQQGHSRTQGQRMVQKLVEAVAGAFLMHSLFPLGHLPRHN